MKKQLFILLLLLASLQAYSQETLRKSLYYPTDGFKLSRSQKTELNAFLDSAFLSAGIVKSISISGHTDSAASVFYNIKLSEKRSAQVQKCIRQKGLKNVEITTKSFGEEKPQFAYSHPNAMAKNRRVDIEILFHSAGKISEFGKSKTTIVDLYKLLQTPSDTFYIQNNVDTVLRAKNGTIIQIPANSLCVRENGWERVKIAVKEISNTENMISQNASTGSSNNPLITGGMVQILAFDLRNNPLQICNDKAFTILLPTTAPDENMQLFYASRDDDFGLNWNLHDSDLLLDVIPGDLFNRCYYPERFGSGGSGHCRLFFCKIRRAINHLKTQTFVSKKRKQSRNFASYQQRSISEALINYCEARDKKLKEIEEKFAGLNSAKLGELTDEEASYYIFNTMQLGWINCDRFMGLPQKQLTNLVLPIKSDVTTDVKLIFNGDKTIMPSYDISGKVGFPNVPKGTKAKLLGLRFENGQPALALQEVTIGENMDDYQLEFKDYTLAELKALLKDL